MWRVFASFLFALLVVGVLAGVGAEAYQAGVAQGIVDAGRFPAGATVPVAGGYGHRGFDVFGLLVPLLFLFLLFGLLRAAFSRGGDWGHRGHGHGWGRDWDGDGLPFSDGARGWREGREQRMAELHRRLHEADAGAGSAPGPGSAGTAGGPGGSSGR